MEKNLIEKITDKQIKKDIPEFKVGYTVNVGCKIIEVKGGKEKERIQNFEGIVISRKGKGATETFTVVVCFCQVHSSSSSKLPKLSPADASATRGRSNSGNGCCSIQPFTKATASCNLSFGMRNVSSS